MGALGAVPEPSGSPLEAAEGARRAGRLGESRQAFMAVADAAEGAGDASTLVAAALGAGGLWVHEQRDVIARASVHALWQRARAVAPADSLARARLVVREAAEAVYDGAPLEPVVAAVDHVRAFEDERATAEAMSLFHNVQLGPRYGEERLRLAEEIIRRSARADDSLLALMGLCWRTVDLFLLGYPRAVQSLTELRERCTVVGCEAIGFIADVLDAMLLARAGRLDDAEKATTAALERGLAAGDPDAPAYYGAMLAALRWWQGRGGEVIDFVQALAISPRLGLNDHVYVAASALLSASEGEEDAAEEWLARLGSIGLSNLPDSSSWLTTQLLVIEAAYVLGDAMTAKEAGELLRPYTSLPVMPSLAVVCLGSAERGLGLAAATMGEFDQAVEHLSAALRADRTLGSRPMGALTEHTLAAVLRARGVSGDDARAERLASRADEQARRMGMELPQHPGWLPTEAQARPNPRTRHASLERVFNGWSVGVDGRSTILPDRVGLAYLAELLAHPGQELDAMAIASHVSIDPPASAEPILDDSALSAYRRRVRELTLLLERTDLSSIQVKQHRRELAALTATLRSATGMHGRSRAFPGNHERARTAVRKAIVRALASIHIADPELGEHLRRNVVTGASCRYLPDSGWSINRAENERNRDVANDSPVFEGSENSRAPVGRDSR